MNNNPVRWNDPSGHCLVLCTAVIGAAIGAIVGAVGYTVYAAASGTEFNTGTMLLTAGGGAVAGGLVGSIVGVTAGISAAAATTTAVTAGGAATSAATALGADGDPTNEIRAATQAVQGVGATTTAATTVLNATGGDPSDEISKIGQIFQKIVHVTDKARGADQFLDDAVNFLGNKYQQVASGIYRSTETLRQVRFTDRDLLSTHGNIGPHGHFELLDDALNVIKNIHIPLIDP